MSDSFEFSRGHSVHFAKIPDVKIFKRQRFLMLLLQFSFNFNETLEKACNPGKYRPLLFLVICHILNTGIWHFEEKLPNLLAIIHEAILVSSGKKSGRRQAPWASCYEYDCLLLTSLEQRVFCVRWLLGSMRQDIGLV